MCSYGASTSLSSVTYVVNIDLFASFVLAFIYYQTVIYSIYVELVLTLFDMSICLFVCLSTTFTLPFTFKFHCKLNVEIYKCDSHVTRRTCVLGMKSSGMDNWPLIHSSNSSHTYLLVGQEPVRWHRKYWHSYLAPVLLTKGVRHRFYLLPLIIETRIFFQHRSLGHHTRDCYRRSSCVLAVVVISVVVVTKHRSQHYKTEGP